MKKITKLGMFFALLITFAAQSHAALLLEPLVGYSVGQFNNDFNNPIVKDTHDNLHGTSYGGRVGYQNFGFQLGVDYLASNLTVDKDNFKTSEWGGFVGFEFPILVRVYAGYVFSGTGKADGVGVNGADVTYKGASGPKVGVGFTLLPFLDINLEYRRISYDNKDLGTGLNSDADYSATMLAFSLPFTI